MGQHCSAAELGSVQSGRSDKEDILVETVVILMGLDRMGMGGVFLLGSSTCRRLW